MRGQEGVTIFLSKENLKYHIYMDWQGIWETNLQINIKLAEQVNIQRVISIAFTGHNLRFYHKNYLHYHQFSTSALLSRRVVNISVKDEERCVWPRESHNPWMLHWKDIRTLFLPLQNLPQLFSPIFFSLCRYVAEYLLGFSVFVSRDLVKKRWEPNSSCHLTEKVVSNEWFFLINITKKNKKQTRVLLQHHLRFQAASFHQQ